MVGTSTIARPLNTVVARSDKTPGALYSSDFDPDTESFQTQQLIFTLACLATHHLIILLKNQGWFHVMILRLIFLLILFQASTLIQNYFAISTRLEPHQKNQVVTISCPTTIIFLHQALYYLNYSCQTPKVWLINRSGAWPPSVYNPIYFSVRRSWSWYIKILNSNMERHIKRSGSLTIMWYFAALGSLGWQTSGFWSWINLKPQLWSCTIMTAGEFPGLTWAMDCIPNIPNLPNTSSA